MCWGGLWISRRASEHPRRRCVRRPTHAIYTPDSDPDVQRGWKMHGNRALRNTRAVQMAYERTRVPLSRLRLNLENDRHGPLGSQRECIIWMLEHLQEQILNLARDIAQQGLSPLDGVLTIPAEDDPEEYVVWEGNRRLTALKLLEDPARAEDENITRRFREMLSESTVLPTELEIIVAPSVEDADRLIELRHQGPQSGIGTVPWTAGQKSRHQARLGKRGRYAFSQEVVDAVVEKLDPELQSAVRRQDYPISTLDRLLKNTEVRQFLGITNEDGTPRRILHEAETLKGLSKMLRDIGRGMPVGQVYDSKRQQQYLNTFRPEETPDQGKTLKDSKVLHPNEGRLAEAPEQKRKRSKPSALDRKTLIPSDVIYRINHTRLNEIYRDLRRLSVRDHPNAVAVLFRVFLELGTELYLEQYSISYHLYNDKLAKKVSKALEHARDQQWIDKRGAKGIEVQINDRTSLMGADTLNAYVHNSSYIPTPRELNTLWGNIQPYLDVIIGHLG